MKKNKKIAIFMPRFIGDCINCTPAIQLIKKTHPNARITLVIRALPAQVFERDQQYKFIIDKRLDNKLQGIWLLLKALRKETFDTIILMTNTFIDALIARIGNGGNIIGYNKELRKPLLSQSIKLDITRHYINRYAYLANLYCDNQHIKLPRVCIPFDQKRSVLTQHKQLKIGFCIVSKKKLSRHYPATSCANAIQLINKQAKKGCFFYMLGAPDEQVEANDVVKICKQNHLENIESLVNKTSIAQLIDTIADLDLLITVDSGPLHIASATNTLTIALHSKGTSAFSTVCPKGDHVHVINAKGGYIDDNDQVNDLMPEDIANKALTLLGI